MHPLLECGLAYPSTETRGNAENFALTTAAADNNLKFENAKWYKIDSIQGASYTVTRLAYSDSDIRAKFLITL